jgi:hypothetical protein
MTPDRLFHYQPFHEDHLATLFASSRPDSFNDPWDCRVHYKVPTDTEGRKRVVDYLTELHRKRHPSVPEPKRALRAYELKTDITKFEAAYLQLEGDLYAAICNRYRIYCLTERADVPLMWGHYAVSHTGVCVEFDGRVSPFADAIQVQYLAAYPARDVVEHAGYEPLITKSRDWSYEGEWRLISEESGAALSAATLKTDNDFLILPAGAVKSVTIGALADETSRRKIERLIKTKAPDVVVRQASLAQDRYELVITPAFA